MDGFAKCLKIKVNASVKPKDLLMEKERISKTGYANLQPRQRHSCRGKDYLSNGLLWRN